MTKVAILGFGTVGSGVAEVLSKNSQGIARRSGGEIQVKYILDVRDFPDSPFKDCFVKDFSIIENDPEVEVVVETIGGAKVALEFTTRALKAGKSVVSSNKELVATHGYELLQLAKANGVSYLFEASVGGGIPILRPLTNCLSANEVEQITGILNGTTNYILTRMIKAGLTFEQALKEAQDNGYAEKDPTADVDGVYTADPRLVKGAKKLEEITFDEMLELASLGAQVLHNRSVEMAKRYNVNLEVLSSLTGNPGTKVKEVVKTMEKTHVSGVAKDKNVARLALIGLADEPGIAFKIFSLLAKKNINVDIILQSIGRDESKDISFTVARGDSEEAQKILEENKDYIGFKAIEVNNQVAKVSIVGAGMVNNAGVACKMFEALSSAGVNINMISTSEIKVSVLVDEREADRAVQAIHDRFFNEFGSAN